MAAHPLSTRRGLILAAGTLGFGLSGFFDGILLHQILQWHHLLSLVPGEAMRDIGNQIVADGLFHLAMYAIAGAGLLMLWRRRAALRESGASGAVGGGALVGFGAWHAVDAVLVHWTLGLHRIRVDVPDPLIWDLGWLAAFGIAPAIFGVIVLRRGSARRSGPAAGAILSLLAIVAAPLAALPVPGGDGALMLLRPGAGAGPAISAALAADARILWIDPDARVMALSLPRSAETGSLYRAGALLVTRSPMLAGCAAAVARTS